MRRLARRVSAVRAHIPMVEVIRQIYPRIYGNERFVVYDCLGNRPDLSKNKVQEVTGQNVEELPRE